MGIVCSGSARRHYGLWMRTFRILAVIWVASVAALTSCSGNIPGTQLGPSATPIASGSPTPRYTPGANAEADIAAAIETYEAYVAANSATKSSDETTWRPALNFLVGEQRDAQEEGLRSIAQSGYIVGGPTMISNVQGVALGVGEVELTACENYTAVEWFDASGAPIDRGTPDELSVRVEMQWFENAGWLISGVFVAEAEGACQPST